MKLWLIKSIKLRGFDATGQTNDFEFELQLLGWISDQIDYSQENLEFGFNSKEFRHSDFVFLCELTIMVWTAWGC